MENKKSFLESLIGPKPSTTAQTTANLIGGLLLGGGFLGAYGQQPKSYTQATKDIQSNIQAILPTSDIRAEKAQTQLAADLAGYKTRAEMGVESGLAARGITDKAVAKESVGRLGSGLSGAYATAAAALKGAKVRAKGQLSASMSQYQQDLAQKQYQSLMQNYASKMGIWGALGGLGVGVLGMPSITKEKKEEKIDTTDKGLLNKEGI